MIKIVEKYFTQEDFSKREKETLEIAISKTGFKPQIVLFKGVIFDPDKVGSIIYKGIYKGKPSVLKLQGLAPETDEADILMEFKKQNKSRRIRLPELYSYKKWNEKDKFGFLITEFVPYPKLHPMPFPNEREIKLFCDFYQEYKTKAITKPFTKLEEDNDSSKSFVIKRVETWAEISNYKSILKNHIPKERIAELIERYKIIMEDHLAGNLVFSHGHLSSKDILYNGKEFILLSNLYWSYRPKFYDLIFDLHWCLEAINDEKFIYSDYVGFVKKWIKNFYKIPVVKNDSEAVKNIHLMLLERTMGAILIDTGSRSEENRATEVLLKLQLKFFDELVERIKKTDYFPG